MTDFFIGQTLTFILLAISLIRPCTKFLIQIKGLTLFPFLALLIQICILLGQGLTLEGIFFFIFTLIVFLTSLPRAARFFKNLKTDWYAPSGVICSLIGFVIVILLFILLIFTSPCIPPTITTPKQVEEKTLTFYRSKTGQYSFEKPENFFTEAAGECTVWYPVQTGTKPIPVVFYFPNVATLHKGRRIASTILAGNGYFVLSVAFNFENTEYGAPFMGSSFLRIPILQLEQSIAKDMYSVTSLETDFHTKHQSQEMSKLLSVIKYLPEIPLLNQEKPFAIADGTSVNSIIELTQKEIFAKAVVIPNFDSTLKNTIKIKWNEPTPMEANQFKILEICGEKNDFLSFGESEIQTPLFALLNGSCRDKEGKKSIFIGQKIRTFFDGETK